jgi:exopolyphosphatase/guanosine-5'-triphosphate,3'-diphosphate pyrophosphatase
MRIAVIDCGTNTFHLLIADVEGESFRYVLRRKMVVKLGSDRIEPNVIADKRYEKAIRIMVHYARLIEMYGAKKILTAGTAALRDATNGAELVKDIKKASGIKVNLISGDEEASLIHKGVCKAVSLNNHTSLVMDIGGGSTEFILCNSEQVLWKQSFRLGGARLLQILQPSDPFTSRDLKKLDMLLARELKPLFHACKKNPPLQLIGASGSFETFASILLHQQGKPNALRGKTNYNFRLPEYQKLHNVLVKSSYAARLQMPGMLRMRADMIVMASLLLTFVLNKCAIKHLELSTYALKEGLLATTMKN